MKIQYQLSIVLAGLLGCCSGTRADFLSAAERPMILPVWSGVVVKEVTGTVEYAYLGTGWRLLAVDKCLKPGACIRAKSGSAAVLQVHERSTLFRVCSHTVLHLTQETPEEELAVMVAR